ncbi:MAG: response regulator [Planctomycetes bacterium]|nr:response regulator [Planctomycetota bacterium]MBL7106912.1 response regulator [Phycisphaerae bacterium]
MDTNDVILIAEDDQGHFELIKRNLWRSCVDNEIINFRDGQQVLNFLFMKNGCMKREPGRGYILLLDIRMPKVDGVEVLKRMKSDSQLCKIPVIMLTTTDDVLEISRCYDLGCSFYIVKPADYSRFMEAVENLGRFISLDGLRLPKIGE